MNVRPQFFPQFAQTGKIISHIISVYLPMFLGFTCCVSINAFGQSTAIAIPGSRVEQEAKRVPEPIKRSVQIDQPYFPDQIPAGADQIRFKLSGVTISGMTVTGDDSPLNERFSATWKEKIGTTITLVDVFRIAGAISAQYRNAGYILSQAIVPKQDLAVDGANLRIEIVEGYIANVSFHGEAQLNQSLKKYESDITSERPLTLQTLERKLLLFNELAGVSARGSLKPSSVMGASDLDVNLAHDNQAYSVGMHNRTSEATGDVRIEGTADYFGVVSAFDRHSLRYITSGSERLNYLAYSGDTPIGSDGFKFNWTVSKSEAEPKSDIPFNLDSDSENYGLGVAYPFIRSRTKNVDIRFGIGASNSQSSSQFETRDRLRVVRAGLTWDLLDAWRGLNILDVEVSQGIDGMGASESEDPRLSRNGLAEPNFTKETLYMARLQSLGGPWTLLLAATGQHSDDTLATSEMFGLGGETFLRAFDPSELIGDKGIAGKGELRFDIMASPFAATIYVYQDAGKVFFDVPEDSQSILSTGLGVRFNAPYGMRGYVEASKPRHKDANSTGDQDVRLFGGLVFSF